MDNLRNVGKVKVTAILTLSAKYCINQYNVTPSDVTKMISESNFKYQEHGRIRRWAFDGNVKTLTQAECTKLRKKIIKDYTEQWQKSAMA